MERLLNYSNALLLEDFDIWNIAKESPDLEVGVNVNRIYIQIAKINGNPQKKKELQLLVKSLPKINLCDDMKEPAYVPMKTEDILTCFSKHLKHLPKNTFIKI